MPRFRSSLRLLPYVDHILAGKMPYFAQKTLHFSLFWLILPLFYLFSPAFTLFFTQKSRLLR